MLPRPPVTPSSAHTNINMHVRTMYALSAFATPTSITRLISAGCIRSIATSSSMNSGASSVGSMYGFRYLNSFFKSASLPYG